jgi:hypothetical protein
MIKILMLFLMPFLFALSACVEGDSHFKNLHRKQEVYRKKIEKRRKEYRKQAEQMLKNKAMQLNEENQYFKESRLKALAKTNLDTIQNPPFVQVKQEVALQPLESNQVAPNQVAPNQVAPNQVAPNQANPNQADPNQADPNQPQVLDLNAPTPEPVIQKLDAYRAKVGNVLIDREKKKIEIPAKINMNKGILEYIAVSTQGKLHEAVLEILAVPSHIHLALILAGYEEAKVSEPDPKTYERKILKPGSYFNIYVEWTPEGYQKQRKNQKSAPQQIYMFRGSSFWKGKYTADIEKSVIALIEDGTCVLVPVSDYGNPYRGGDLGFEVYTDAIPPVGTRVNIVVEGAKGELPKQEEEPIKSPETQSPETQSPETQSSETQSWLQFIGMILTKDLFPIDLIDHQHLSPYPLPEIQKDKNKE